MTRQTVVLHDVELQPLPRRLPRNAPGRPTTVTAASNAAPTIRVTAVVDASDPIPKLVPSANIVGTLTQQQVAIVETDANGFASGYQEGYRKARQEADQDMRRMAAQLAEGLAEERIQHATTQAKESYATQVEIIRQELIDEWHQKLTQLAALLEQLPVQFHAYLADAEDDMLALVYEVVCRIFGEEGASLPGLRAQLQQCLKAWHGHAMLTIELHPDDIALLQNDDESLKLLKTGGFSSERSTLRWVADPRVNVGGCRLRSAEGILDARLEVQFKALEAALLSTRASRKHLASMEQLP